MELNSLFPLSFDNTLYPLEFQTGFVPQNILDYYLECNEFIYVNLRTVKCIPVLRETWYLKEKDDRLIDEFDSAFMEYAKGFLKGFECDFMPNINNPEAKIEMILKAIGIDRLQGFPVTVIRTLEGIFVESYNPKLFYKMGFDYGMNYKAWLAVLETPLMYVDRVPFIGFLSDKSGLKYSTLIDVTNERIGHTEYILERLKANGFYELQSVKRLNGQARKRIDEMILGNDMPYQIALFRALEFDDYLLRNVCSTKREMFALIASKIYLKPGSERSVKGLFNVLNVGSKENKNRSTSWKHIETIKKEIENLK